MSTEGIDSFLPLIGFKFLFGFLNVLDKQCNLKSELVALLPIHSLWDLVKILEFS